MAVNSIFSLGQLDFDPRSGELRTREETRRLEPKAAAVLHFLCEHEGAVVSRQDLLDRCWGDGEGSDEALTQAIAQIRRALDELGEPGLVETLAKRGYRLKAAEPARRAQPMPSVSDSGVRRLLIPGAALAGLAVILLLISSPHGPRHAVRHALGLGPPSTANH